MKRIYFISLLALLFGCAFGVQQSATTINPARAQLVGVGVNDFIFFTGGGYSLMDTYNTNTNTWSQSDLGCVATGAVSVGNYALFHCNSEYISTIHIFNSVSQTWSSKSFESGNYRPIAISCGQFALIGGGATSSVFVFNSTDQSWKTISLTKERYSVGECTNNYAVYSTDVSGSGTTNVVNIITGQVTEGNTSYSTYKSGIAKAGKFILIAGGSASPYDTNKVAIFNTETQTWSTSQLSSVRVNMASASIGDFAIFAGGSSTSYTIDVFNANTMTWSTSTLADAGYEFTSVVVGPYVMIGGGATTSEYSSRLTVFNSTDQTWSVMYLSSPRFRIGTASSGNIAVWAGGYRDSYSPLINVVDIYDFTENIVVSPPVTAPVAAPVATPVAAPVSGVSSVMPTDDATVRNGIYANNNYALEPTMYIKYSTNPDFTRQLYIKFPLQNLLPVGSSRVVVRLLGYYQSTLGPLNVQCYAVPSNTWNQSTITWNNKPALGALLSSTDIIHPISYYEWDVTAYVTGQQSSGATHVSFAFVRNAPGPDESTVLINSLEADVNRPMLAITN